jgi:hypothetical protein
VTEMSTESSDCRGCWEQQQWMTLEHTRVELDDALAKLRKLLPLGHDEVEVEEAVARIERANRYIAAVMEELS